MVSTLQAQLGRLGQRDSNKPLPSPEALIAPTSECEAT